MSYGEAKLSVFQQYKFRTDVQIFINMSSLLLTLKNTFTPTISKFNKLYFTFTCQEGNMEKATSLHRSLLIFLPIQCENDTTLKPLQH